MEVVSSTAPASNSSNAEDLIEWEDDIDADWYEVNLRFGSGKNTIKYKDH